MRPGGAFTVTALVALNVGRATISSHGGADVAMTIGALGYLAAFGDMNLLSARVRIEIARLLSAFTGLGGQVGSRSA